MGRWGPDLADQTDEQLIAGLQASWRVVAREQATQVAAVAELAARRGLADLECAGSAEAVAFAAVAVELAGELTLTSSAAERLLAECLGLAQRLPATVDALAAGVLDWPRAVVLVAGVARVPLGLARAVEAAVLPDAASLTVPQLRALVERTVIGLDPAAAAGRHARARAMRRVRFRPVADGMCEVWALLPADLAMALKTRIWHDARQQTPDDSRAADQRTLDERRADALAALADGVPAHGAHTAAGEAGEAGGGDGGGGGGGGGRAGGPTGGSRAQVIVTMSAATLAGLDEQPAELAGYGPIIAGMGRDLAAGGSWRAAAVDEAHGTLLALTATPHTPNTPGTPGTSTSGYRPGAALRRHLAVRDTTCRAPGCTVPALLTSNPGSPGSPDESGGPDQPGSPDAPDHSGRVYGGHGVCDIDHITPWPAGTTDPENTWTLCRRHHRVKHAGGLTVAPSTDPAQPPGTIDWITPTGHRIPSPPARIHHPVPTMPRPPTIAAEAATDQPPDHNRGPGERPP